jgi:hypothetical protein
MGADQAGYCSFLLRLWLANDGDSGQWRASLQDPHTGMRVGFASLEQLFAHLQEHFGNSSSHKNQSDLAGERGF